MALVPLPSPIDPPNDDEPPPPRSELSVHDSAKLTTDPKSPASFPLPSSHSTPLPPSTEVLPIGEKSVSTPVSNLQQSTQASDPPVNGEDPAQCHQILTALAQDIKTLLGMEAGTTQDGETETPEQRQSHSEGKFWGQLAGASNGGAKNRAAHATVQHQSGSVHGTLKASKQAAAQSTARSTTAQAWPDPEKQTRFSGEDKAKGVLEMVEATLAASSSRPSSSHHTRAPSTEDGEHSRLETNQPAKGRWAEVKPPYWWRKEQQESRPSTASIRKTDPEKGRELFRRHAAGKCFNCFSTGHQVRDCNNLTRCWRCERSGHLAFECPKRHQNPSPTKSPPASTHHRLHSVQVPPSASIAPARDARRRSYLEALQGSGAMAYPGDPRARPTGERICISATGAIKQRRDKLVGKAAVCWLDGDNHDTKLHQASDAIRAEMGLNIRDFQVVKHFPEQYLVIFSNPRDMQRAVRDRYIVHGGRTYNFAPWDETREAADAHMEYRVYVRIEGIPPHAWGPEVAEKVLGKDCAIHYVEEHTRRRSRTRTFDLWAWCSNPCRIPSEVWLTITDPDLEQSSVELPLPQVPVHHDPPSDIKHGLRYRILPHVAAVEDLSFIRGNGGHGGLPNRKRLRNFVWRYGVPDILGEERERQLEGRGRGGQDRRRRDDEEDERRDRHRRHRSASAWARISRCRTGAADCYSTNIRSAGGSYRSGGSYRYRDAKMTKLVYKIKVAPEPRQTRDIGMEEAIREGKMIIASAEKAGQVGRMLGANKGGHVGLTDSGNKSAIVNNHLIKPINLGQMTAVQVLIEHGTKLEKKAEKINKAAAKVGVA